MAAAVDVLVVDDSAVIRGMISRGIGDDPDIRIVGAASNGEAALGMLGSLAPRVVLLDVEMPVMNGLEALPKILAARPGVSVIMASALTRRHAGMSLKALQLGASDYVPKPDAADGPQALPAFFEELKVKIKSHGRPKQAAAVVTRPRTGTKLRALRPAAVAIGSSTGGPPALLKVFAAAKGAIRVPVFVTQHMPPMFTAMLAEQLGQVAGAHAAEGADGMCVRAGAIYVAPGGRHMLVARDGGDVIIRLSDAPPENFCKPAVDPMLRSLAEAYGHGLLAAILTGMGRDGADGCIEVARAGGHFCNQDEPTSTVYGMPAAAFRTGMSMGELPLDDLALYLAEAMKGGA